MSDPPPESTDPLSCPSPDRATARLHGQRRFVAGRLLALASQLMSREEAEAMSEQERATALQICDMAKDAIHQLPYSPEAYYP